MAGLFGVDIDILTTIVNVSIIAGLILGAIHFFGRTIMKRLVNAPEIKNLSTQQQEVTTIVKEIKTDIVNKLDTSQKLEDERFGAVRRLQDQQLDAVSKLVTKTEAIDAKLNNHLVESGKIWIRTEEHLKSLRTRQTRDDDSPY